MKTNIDTIQEVVDYIDNHLEENLSLDSISNEMNYSKYHLSRMFMSVVGFTVHSYIQRRRLTEAARLLIFTDKPIMEIALFAGYETQQSFTIGFKALFNHLVLNEKLFPHLNKVDEQAQHLLDTMIPPMAKVVGITEQLKATDQMEWVGLMTAVKAQIEEVIFAELIYC